MDISDTLMYVYEMLGAELLSSLYDKLGRLLTNTEQPSSWQVSKEPRWPLGPGSPSLGRAWHRKGEQKYQPAWGPNSRSRYPRVCAGGHVPGASSTGSP